MEFKFRAVDDRPPPAPYMSPAACLGYFSDLACRAGYSHGFDNVQLPIDTPEAIYLREMEKQRIREEIIAEEVARRRVLEAEVRRELMVEREMAIRRAAEMRLPYEQRFSMQSDSRLSYTHPFDNRWLEEQRAYTSLCGHGCNQDLFPPPGLPLRLPEPPCDEVKASSNCNKDKLIILARPDPNLAGKKRKTRPESGVLTLPLTSLKKPKEEWCCALCQVSATSEKGLNEHLQGRKHQGKEEELRAQRMAKDSQPRPFPKKTGKHSRVAKAAVTASSETERAEKKSFEFKKTGNDCNQKMKLKNKDLEVPLRKNPGAVNFENKNKEALRMAPEFKNKKKKKNHKEKFDFWCEICSMGAHSEVVMNAHIKGRRHKARLQKLNKNGKALLAPINTSNPTSSIIEETQIAKDENMIDHKAIKNSKEDIPDAYGSSPYSVGKLH